MYKIIIFVALAFIPMIVSADTITADAQRLLNSLGLNAGKVDG